jgi:hypothetical protein
MRSVTIGDLESRGSPRIWVTRPDQTVVLVESPQVFRGKLVGFVDGKYRELPPTDLGDMRVRRLATGRTLTLVGAGIATAAVAAVLVAGSHDHFDPCVGSEDEEDDGCVTPTSVRRGY